MSKKRRAPFQVLIFPFCSQGKGTHQFLVLRRTDEQYWQAIAGGGDEGESPIQAAQRESSEEAGIEDSTRFFQLTSTCSIPVIHFENRDHWPKDLLVIPEYSFAVELSHTYPINLSNEHTEYKWLSFDEAQNLLHWDSNKTALWELNERLKRQCE